jgi:hypothetical protein
MKPRAIFLLLLIVGLAVLLGQTAAKYGWFQTFSSANSPRDARVPAGNSDAGVSTTDENNIAVPASLTKEGGEVYRKISLALERLRSGDLPTGSLRALREYLLKGDPAAGIAAIRAFLETGKNALTGEEFQLASGGILDGAPTYRLLLLDILGQLSRKISSPAAAEVAKAVFAKKDSAEEWALALRNTAWASPEAGGELLDRFREMIAYEPWRRQPSRGFLEAFDVVVYTRAVQAVPELAQLLEDQNDQIPRAAGVTLDRLAEHSPAEVMSLLNQNPALLADRPKLRADYYTKADFSKPEQRQLVEAYLSRPDVTPAEKQKLLGGLASPGTFVSDNLLTPPTPAEESPDRIKNLRKTVGDWLQTNRFPELTPALRVLGSRLAEIPEK